MRYLAVVFDRVAGLEEARYALWFRVLKTIGHTFVRFALPMTWDFAESNPICEKSGGYSWC